MQIDFKPEAAEFGTDGLLIERCHRTAIDEKLPVRCDCDFPPIETAVPNGDVLRDTGVVALFRRPDVYSGWFPFSGSGELSKITTPPTATCVESASTVGDRSFGGG